MVVHLGDLLARRTRLALIDPAAGIGESGSAAALLAGEFGWSEGQMQSEVEFHRKTIERERGTHLRSDAPPVGASSSR
jgi:glycerol-3-phosphate dehydrogenase